jgi:hypothetical protein
MENILPIMQSNTVTGGLILNTIGEVGYKLAEKNYLALARNGIAAALLGFAASVGLPELGLYTSPELITYAAFIGFNLPALYEVAVERSVDFGKSSLAYGAAGAALGGIVDYFAPTVNANAIIKMVGNGMQYFRNLKLK